MQQDYPNAEANFSCRNDRPMSSPGLVKLRPRTPENERFVSRVPPLKLHGENMLNCQ